jgi:hypothetical protein
MSDPMLMEIQRYADHVIFENSGANFRPEDTEFRYPDASVVEIIGELARLTHAPVKKILEDFGKFIADDMARQPGPAAAREPLSPPASRTLSVLESVGTEMERAAKDGARPLPPQFRGRRTSVDEVMVAIEKGRHWCTILKSLVDELGEKFDEPIEWCETGCLNEGDDACHLFVTLGDAKHAA